MSSCKNVKKDVLAICILIPILVGGLSSLFTSGSMDLYSTIQAPSFAPPGFLFPIVWTILYILMGVSCYLVYTSTSEKVSSALVIYGIQLGLNFAWSIIFFNYRAFLLAFLWLVVLWITILIMILRFYEINKAAAWLQVPYLLWVTFAGVLNFSIYLLNRS